MGDSRGRKMERGVWVCGCLGDSRRSFLVVGGLWEDVVLFF